MTDAVTVRLTRDEALVLMEFLQRVGNDGEWSVEDSSEIRALRNLESVLEKTLPEVLDPRYRELVDAARLALRDPGGTNASGEQAAGRLSLWLEPNDIAFIADEWRKLSASESEEARGRWSRIAFRAMSALHKAGIEYIPKFPPNGEDDPGTA